MKPFKYLSTLLPSFEKARIREDIGLLREEMNDSVIPTFANAAEAMKKRKFISKDVQAFDKDFGKEVKVRTRGNFVVVTNAIMENVRDNLDTVEMLVERYYSDDIFRDAMTFLKINLLQYVEAITFTIRYARRNLLWTYAEEIAGEDPDVDVGDLTRGELQWLSENKSTYFACLKILSGDKKDLEKVFAEIPDVVVSEQSERVVPSTVGADRVDPFRFDFIPVKLNPIYHARMAIAEWQVARHRAAQEEKRMLEFRLLQLKTTQDGERNAKLEQQIEYTQGRIEKLNFKVQKMEEDYG